MTGDIVVNLAGGTYRLTSTLTFGTSDSATNGHSVIYQAVAGSTPILSGGTQVTGWTSGSGGVWQASVASGFDTRQLYVDGVRASPASGALPASFTQTSTGYTMSNSTLSSWGNISNVEFVYNVAWTQMRCGVASASGTSVTMKQPCFANSTARGYGVNAGIPDTVENAHELLTQPGQWYLDRSANTIYYYPRSGENLATADVEVPSLQTIVSGAGTEAAPLTNLEFRGIFFEYGTWLAPNGNDGFSEVQANMTFTGTDANTNQGSCTRFSSSNPGTCPYGAWTMTPGNVSFSFTAGLTFDRNTFAHLGGAGLQLGQDASNSVVTGNQFTDISGNGLEVGNGTDANPADLALMPQNNTITNNWVHHVAVEYTGGVGIFQGYVRNSTVAHNQVNDVPYTAISSNWGWGRTATATTGNAISNNLIFDYMKQRFDGGGIYVLGPEGSSMANGLTISGNVIHTAGGAGNTIYTDGGSQWVTITSNVLYGTGTADWGGCYEGSGTPYGNFDFENNYWDNTSPSWGCGTPSPVTIANNTAISSSGAGAPSSITDNAGIEAGYRDILGGPAQSTSNLAQGKPAQALYLDGTTAGMQPGSHPGDGVDGDVSTFAQATNRYLWQLQVDLQSTAAITDLKITQPSAAFATAFHIDASTDGSTFSTVATVSGATSGTTDVPLASTVNSRYFRVVADLPNGPNQTGGQMALSEVAIYAAAPVVTTPTNISLNKPAQAQYTDGSAATMQPGSTPGHAVDGDSSTFAQATNQYRWQLLVDTQSVHSVTRIEVTQPSAAYATAFHIDVSTDGTNFSTVSTMTGTTFGTTVVTLPTAASARYVRIVADLPNAGGQTGGQMAISEFAVFG